MPAADIKPVYVIYGGDEFLRREHRASIIDQVVGDSDRQLSVSLHESAAELSEVLDDLRTPAFLAPHRLVIVQDADEFISANREALESYLDKPSDSGTLLMCPKSFPGNTRLAKKVAKVGVKIDCSPPDEKKLPEVIKKMAAARGRAVDGSAVMLLAQWIGPDMGRLDSEISKLSLLTEGRKSITSKDIEQLVVATAGISPWSLTDALDDGDAARAIALLDKLISRPGEEFQVLGLIGWRLRRLIKASQMLRDGAREFDVFREVKVFNRAAQQRTSRVLRNRRSERLAADFRELIRTDLAMKTGRDAKAALQRLIVALC